MKLTREMGLTIRENSCRDCFECIDIFETILRSTTSLNPIDKLREAKAEFDELYGDLECQENLICLPITR